jgi:penicillin-binding protein 2
MINRSRFVNLFVACMFLLLGLGIFNLEIIQGRKLKTLSDKNCIRLLPQFGARGRITDREGAVIADNKLSYDVMILPQAADQSEKALNCVSEVLGRNISDLRDAFNRGYVSPSLPSTILKNIDIKKAIALEEAKLDVPGIVIQPRPTRYYLYGNLAAHVLGYVNEIDHWRLTKLADYGYKTKDIVGFGGLEEKYDYYLRQEEGGSSFEADHRGRLVRLLGFQSPRNGKDLQLTLNLKIQKIVQEQLVDRKGCVIIMDPFTGEIIAMASSPDFNPQAFADKSTSSFSGIFEDPDSPLINRAISGLYPPGSVFKLIVATAALETGKMNSSKTLLCEGSILIGKQKFACWDTHGPQNLIGAIAHSCNVFFYKTGLLTSAQTIYDYAVKFGLSRPTSFELPYEAGGFVPSPLWRKINKFKNWYDGDTANLSIGQGDCLVTPLQMARMMAVFANKGYLVTPYIVKCIGDKDISVDQKKITRLPFKASTINYIREGLREVVSDPAGTGNVLSSLRVSVAGKTGTAQAPRGPSHAWFVGFFPFNNPRFVICVFLERGGPGYVSCVLAKQIIEAMLSQGLI